MIARLQTGIEAWIFDLDDTLYPPSARLVEQIDRRMTRYIMATLSLPEAEADGLRHRYWREHGTTLAGLVADHAIAPSPSLEAVHAIDLSALRPDPHLARAIAALPGRKIVHTNSARAHAERVLAAHGLGRCFDAVFAIEDKALAAKPGRDSYARVLAGAGIDPAAAAMVEDTPRNLVEPHRLGMATIWLDHGAETPTPAHVDLRITGLAPFLAGLADRVHDGAR